MHRQQTMCERSQQSDRTQRQFTIASTTQMVTITSSVRIRHSTNNHLPLCLLLFFGLFFGQSMAKSTTTKLRTTQTTSTAAAASSSNTLDSDSRPKHRTLQQQQRAHDKHNLGRGRRHYKQKRLQRHGHRSHQKPHEEHQKPAEPLTEETVQQVRKCYENFATMELCQRCASETKATTVFPLCCADVDGVKGWCQEYLDFGTV